MKWVPWSLVRLFGHPDLNILFSKMNLAVVSVVHSFTGYTSTHRVRHSVAMIMYLTWEWHAHSVIRLMKSTNHFSKICTVCTRCKGNSSRCDRLLTLWQTSHPFSYSLASLWRLSHNNPTCRTLLAVSFPLTCPHATPAWDSHNTLCLFC